MRTCARVCACVCTCVCMNNEIASSLGFFLSHYEHIPYIRTHSYDFSSCGTIFMFFMCTGDLASCGASDRVIQLRSSLK